ncbi:MAG: hypothetical protein WCY86_13575 [Spirosomataceae bacterium]
MTKENLTLDERNGKLLAQENQMLAQPVFLIGDRIKPNSLGLTTGLQPGELFLVVDQGEKIAKWAGDPTRTMELWNFAEDESLRRTISDPRFFDLVARRKQPANLPAAKPLLDANNKTQTTNLPAAEPNKPEVKKSHHKKKPALLD